MASRIWFVVLAGATALGCVEAPQEEVRSPFAGFEWVDLTHAYDKSTVFWPTGKPFEHVRTSWGETEGGYFYSAYDVAVSEHAGTHIDAPIHFHESGLTVSELPLENLIGPAAVLDVQEQAAENSDYLATVADLETYESRFGEISPEAVVLIRTGWSARWPDVKKYLGDDRPGRTDDLHFPGISPALAEALAERGVKAVGIDTASIDNGPSQDFETHQILAASGVAGLENLTGLDALPESGAWVVAMPMKIAEGSGGPVRVAGLVQH